MEPSPISERAKSIVATLRIARPGETIVSVPSGIVLTILDGPDAGVHTVVGEEVHVGRGRLCDVRLTDPSISEFHFKLSFGDAGVLLEDCSSRNGVWVGRAQIQRAMLLPGAVFQAGACHVRLDEVSTSPTALTTGEQFHGLWGKSAAMRRIFALLDRLATTPVPVLITGETGCGKGMVARALHQRSGRRGKFVTVDCTALPREMAEALLLGHTKGAFTGASRAHSSPFEEADGGTVFLDEIGELPLELQPKLLRVVEEQVVQRVGSHHSQPVDVRLVAATNRDLIPAINAGLFRRDLYHRLACMVVRLPPLRARRDDIELLARVFLADVANQLKTDLQFDDDALCALSREDWRGNVRELRQAVRRTAYLVETNSIGPSDLLLANEDDDGSPPHGAEDPQGTEAQEFPKLEQILDRKRRDYCAEVLERASSLGEAASISGYTPRGLRSMLKRLGIAIPEHFRQPSQKPATDRSR